ncbi:hypothetical protein L1D37_00805 [Vibrio sp. Isolate33]|uniref:hypothetical protein n=1 Tax=Vibrio sp. Isolate33 TaxID=2908539 RepID=UPI001EFD0365|nr:hypothetical protein [Vibrio sp. Isolate33]MCG9542311.1 hypothetical protein [Vibrio sp. Isolate33]
MTSKTGLILLIQNRKRQTKGIPEVQDFFDFLIDELTELSDKEFGEYNYYSKSNSDVLRLVAWQSVPINIEFSERFVDEVLMLSEL